MAAAHFIRRYQKYHVLHDWKVCSSWGGRYGFFSWRLQVWNFLKIKKLACFFLQQSHWEWWNFKMNFSFSFRANFTDNRGSTLLKRQILLVGPGAVEQQSDFKVYHLTSKNKDFFKHLFCIKVLLNGSRFEAAVEISKSRICFTRNNPSHQIISPVNSDKTYCFVYINYYTDIL